MCSIQYENPIKGAKIMVFKPHETDLPRSVGQHFYYMNRIEILLSCMTIKQNRTEILYVYMFYG